MLKGKIRKMWFVLLLFLYSSNMSVPFFFFLKNDKFSHWRCSKSVFSGGVSNQQDSVLYLEAMMRSDRARGLSVFLYSDGGMKHTADWQWAHSVTHAATEWQTSSRALLEAAPRIFTVLLYCHHFLKTSVAT